MSLSQHDQRILADIEQHLTEQDPQLARMLSSLGKVAPMRTLLPRMLRRCHTVPRTTAAFLCLTALLLVVGIAVRSPAVFVTAMAMACVSPLPKLGGFCRWPLRSRRTDR
ncbi:DUF3040 domain-containing protein [Streptomyces guryensis]|uniref:DUF3040 domain-containing protein n=1 Tax=Streptomyces guryensis TaxID=2886947 RepID=A0A9Q3ZAD1_9ACTN|nr:DUF3040 domain-containing protein [Streptomyces guryensis]MCD9879209.1 DUF3040 domain-containing protein [Streptomyces guryensis]